MKIYSPSLNQFLAPELKAMYEASGNWPKDAIEVADEVFFEMRQAVDGGMLLQPGTDGHPVAVEPPAPLLKDAQAAAVERINAEYDRRVLAISAGYPASERESWPVQTSEARALQADAGASTPWIDAAAAARGLDRVDLAQRIVALDDQYRAVHGALSGTRQRLEGEIRAAETAEAIAAVAWPEAT